MNFFGPALEKALAEHGIGKTEFAAACHIDRNQLTNIIAGRTKAPTKIDLIFTAMRGVMPVHECLTLAIAFLEDRRNDIGYSSAAISIRKAKGDTHRTARDRLIDIYDRDRDFRAAIDTIVELIDDADSTEAVQLDNAPERG